MYKLKVFIAKISHTTKVSSSRAVTTLTIPAETNSRSHQDLISLCFSSTHLATGSSMGPTYIWKLSSILTECQPTEERWLERWLRHSEGGAQNNVRDDLKDNPISFKSSSGQINENINENIPIDNSVLSGNFNVSKQSRTNDIVDSMGAIQKPTRWSSAQSSLLGSGVDLLMQKYATNKNEQSNQYDNQEFEEE